MPVRVSVIVPSRHCLDRAGLVSLDQQTLGTADFEVLLADDGTDAEDSTWLAGVAAHRPNVRVVPVAAGSLGADSCREVLGTAVGEHVLVVRGGRRLHPTALEALVELAGSSGADVCLGLTGRVGRRPEVVLPAVSDLPDLANLPGGAPMRDHGHGRIVRRDLLATTAERADAGNQADPADPGAWPDSWEQAATAAARRVAAVAEPCFLDGSESRPVSTPDAARRATEPAAKVSSLRWHGGAVTVGLEPAEGDGALVPADVQVTVFSPGSGMEWAVPEGDVVATPGGLSVRIDPRAIAAGRPLADGMWWPTLRVRSRGETRLGGVRVGPARAAGGSVYGRPVVSFAEDGLLGLDVGGSSHQLIWRLPPRSAVVTEDARGSLLTVAVPRVDLASGTRLDGQLRLGQLPVAACLSAGPDGTAQLTAWLSGLPGRYPLATRFTPAPFATARARLVVGPTGEMRVRPVPTRPAGPPPAAGSAATRRLRSIRDRVRVAVGRR